MDIIMHEHSLNERGTTVALYDYAYFLRKYYGYNPIICHNISASTNSTDAINKFKKEFEVISYYDFDEIQKIVDKKNINYFYAIKYGIKDGIEVKNCKNLIHSVFSTDVSEIHGDVYAVVSEWMTQKSNNQIPFVPHILNIPYTENNLRNYFAIPNDAMVFGRYGGLDTFDIDFVNELIPEILEKRKNFWFIFMNTPKIISHERCIYIDANVDLNYKSEFINTCDAMLHARFYGETFGISVLEFASRNKQIITFDNYLGDRNHHLYLNKNCHTFKDRQSLENIFNNIDKENPFDTSYLNVEFSSKNVMKKFKEVFMKDQIIENVNKNNSIRLKKSKIIDTFTFFNEFEILKLRLKYLNDVVDNFIICESSFTFSGKEKPYYLDEIIDDIPENIRKKIIRLKYDPDISSFEFPQNVTEYKYENYHDKIEAGQRNFIGKNLSNFSIDDFILLSDVDEIPKKQIIIELYNQFNEGNEGDFVYCMKNDFFYYNFKTYLHNNWCGTVISNVKNFIENGTEYYRNQRCWTIPCIENAGWHLSHFYDLEKIKYKIESSSHQEYNKLQYRNESNIIDSIKNKRYIYDENYKFEDYNFGNFPEELKKIVIDVFPKKYYMKIFIFGSNGMLGRYLTKYLSSEFEVISITRNEIDLTNDFSLISEKYEFNETDLIINAAGIIKQRNYSSEELIRINSLFPYFLSTLGCNVIHITTDCVFSGKDGSYTEQSPHDCIDDYGKSKSLGECENLTIIRTSIIGEELENKKSLLEWVKSSKNSVISGYSNHFWNGVTCLELAKHIETIINENSYWKGVRHFFSPDTVSKYELVSYINDVYELNNQIESVETEYCDRSLNTLYTSPIKKTIKEQILDLKKFNLTSEELIKKLENFPTFNYISLTESEDRRAKLNEIFEKYQIKKVFPHVYDRCPGIKNRSDIQISDYWRTNAWWLMTDSYIGALVSHLRAIREWYETTDEPYAFFCEDDLSFDTVEYWNFTWDEFVNNLPEQWNCIQLAISRGSYQDPRMFLFFQPEVYVRSRCWDDYSCVAYLIKREHAKKILDRYYYDDTIFMDYCGIDIDQREHWALVPSVETLIYSVFEYDTVFAFPLFVENIHLNTTVWNDVDYNYGTDTGKFDSREYCYNSIIDWWKTRGKKYTIEDFKTIRDRIIASSKLKNFPPINFISIEESVNRRDILYQKFKEHGITNYTPHIFKRYSDSHLVFNEESVVSLGSDSDGAGRGPTTSHLMAIKNWYFNTDEPYAFFCEDDLSFESVKYWNFTWEEFFNSLPPDWGCIQLCWVREIMKAFSQEGIVLRERCWDDWSACAYLISREHAKKIISNYYRDGIFNLFYAGNDVDSRPDWALRPVAETVIFSNFTPIYGFPLFLEDLENCKTTWITDDNRPFNYYNYTSHNIILDWWKNEAKNLSLSDLVSNIK